MGLINKFKLSTASLHVLKRSDLPEERIDECYLIFSFPLLVMFFAVRIKCVNC